jgi:hypothetical protein
MMTTQKFIELLLYIGAFNVSPALRDGPPLVLVISAERSGCV